MSDRKQIEMIEERSTRSRHRRIADTIRANKARATVLAALLFLFVAALAGLESDQWVSTIMQGLSVGALVFLVASGFQLIFGLMDVLNLAHGELFMLGAYVGWTVYTRFDTFLDVLIPLLLVCAPFALLPLWRRLAVPIRSLAKGHRAVSWGLFGSGLVLSAVAVSKFPLAIWNPDNFAETPVNMSVQIDLGLLAPLAPGEFTWPALVAVLGLVLGGIAMAIGISAARRTAPEPTPLTRRHLIGAIALVGTALLLHLVKGSLNEWVFGLSTTWRFLVAVIVSSLVGAALGAFIEVMLIRPLYDRPIYTLMITLGVGFVLIEAAREIWGRSEFTMARPAAFNGTGEGCPAEGIGGFFSGCSTLLLFGSRLRVYNEGFIVLMGVLVLVAVAMLLKRTRIGMTIRAGVQDPEMVEALGINVRRVFTQVFALGSGLAAFGGVLAAPSIGLSTQMGALFLLTAIVALAIGGLTSFPGAAAGALLIGLLQQVIIRLGQTGINIPFMEEPFKPSPTLVPAASIILMIIILLVLPTGLFGRGER
jgi:branched-chain amino acid transport system permease protein